MTCRFPLQIPRAVLSYKHTRSPVRSLLPRDGINLSTVTNPLQNASQHQTKILKNCTKCYKVSVKEQLSHLNLKPQNKFNSNQMYSTMTDDRATKNVDSPFFPHSKKDCLQPKNMKPFGKICKTVCNENLYPCVGLGYSHKIDKNLKENPNTKTLVNPTTLTSPTKRNYSTVTANHLTYARQLSKKYSTIKMFKKLQSQNIMNSFYLQKCHKSRIGPEISIDHPDRNRDKMRKLFNCDPDPYEVVLKWRETEKPRLDECIPCDPDFPGLTKSVKLKPPKKIYDDQTLPYPHDCQIECEEVISSDTLGYKVVPKFLPKPPYENDCIPCDANFPAVTVNPKLKKIRKIYDDTTLLYPHDCPKPCEKAALRSDLGLKIGPKQLPKVPMSDECIPCSSEFPPITKPVKLKPLRKLYDDTKLKYEHDCKDLCLDVIRADSEYKVLPKKLKKLRFSNDCIPCGAERPTKAVKLNSPVPLYDASLMLYNHYCPIICPNPAPLADEGLKVVPKKLKKLPEGDCIPCDPIFPGVTRSVELPILKKAFDDTQMPYKHICPVECEDAPKRADAGLKIRPKQLKKHIPTPECIPCVDAIGGTKLKPVIPLTKIYDDTTLLYDHVCRKPCDDAPLRSDDIAGYKIVPKLLEPPKSNDCIPCNPQLPGKTVELKRLKKSFDDTKIPPITDEICDEMCNIDPPRMDDVLCWRPKKKRLPTFGIKQVRKFSTSAPSSKTLKSVLIQNLLKNGFENEKSIDSSFNNTNCLINDTMRKKIIVRPYSSKVINQNSSNKLEDTANAKICSEKTQSGTECNKFEPEQFSKKKTPYASFSDQYEVNSSEYLVHSDYMHPKNQYLKKIKAYKDAPPSWGDVNPTDVEPYVLHSKNHAAQINPLYRMSSHKFKPNNKAYIKSGPRRRLYTPYISFDKHSNPCGNAATRFPQLIKKEFQRISQIETTNAKILEPSLPAWGLGGTPLVLPKELNELKSINLQNQYLTKLKSYKAAPPSWGDVKPIDVEPYVSRFEKHSPQATPYPRISIRKLALKARESCIKPGHLPRSKICAPYISFGEIFNMSKNSRSECPQWTTRDKKSRFQFETAACGSVESPLNKQINQNQRPGIKETNNDCFKPKNRRYSTNCHHIEYRTRPKQLAPYQSFSETYEPPYAKEPDCCEDVLSYLQPDHRPDKRRHIVIPPAWGLVNPALAEKCISKRATKPYRPKVNIINKCPRVRVSNCVDRARQYCGHDEPLPCNKIFAPYPSFGEQRPKFKRIEESECLVANNNIKRTNKFLFGNLILASMADTLRRKLSGVCSKSSQNKRLVLRLLNTREKCNASNENKSKKLDCSASSASTSKGSPPSQQPEKEDKGSPSKKPKNTKKSNKKKSCKDDCMALCLAAEKKYNASQNAEKCLEKSKSSDSSDCVGNKCNSKACECYLKSKKKKKSSKHQRYSSKKRSHKDTVVSSKVKKGPMNSSKCIPKKRPNCWQRIVNYFKARPNCPAPGDWKKKDLKDRAYAAAKAAGFEICEKRICGKVKRVQSVASISKKGKKNSAVTDANIRKLCTFSKTENFPNGLTVPNLPLKNATAMSTLSNDNIFVGKMYQVKLSKIGVKNNLIKNNNDEEPYTLCQICKFVPRNTTICHRTESRTKHVSRIDKPFGRRN